MRAGGGRLARPRGIRSPWTPDPQAGNQPFPHAPGIMQGARRDSDPPPWPRPRSPLSMRQLRILVRGTWDLDPTRAQNLPRSPPHLEQNASFSRRPVRPSGTDLSLFFKAEMYVHWVTLGMNTYGGMKTAGWGEGVEVPCRCDRGQPIPREALELEQSLQVVLYKGGRPRLPSLYVLRLQICR